MIHSVMRRERKGGWRERREGGEGEKGRENKLSMTKTSIPPLGKGGVKNV